MFSFRNESAILAMNCSVPMRERLRTKVKSLSIMKVNAVMEQKSERPEDESELLEEGDDIVLFGHFEWDKVVAAINDCYSFSNPITVSVSVDTNKVADLRGCLIFHSRH